MRKLSWILLLCYTFAPTAYAAPNFSLGAELQANTWRGDNGDASKEFSSDGGQFNLQFKMRMHKWYAGVIYGGGKYLFNAVRPGAPETENAQIAYWRGEFDLVGGYQFWNYVSLFADLKISAYSWDDGDRKQISFGGLGAGGQWHYPIADNWNLYGSLGIGSGQVKLTSTAPQANGATASGRHASLIVGAAWRISRIFSLHANLLNQSVVYRFDIEQKHQIGGLAISGHFLF